MLRLNRALLLTGILCVLWLSPQASVAADEFDFSSGGAVATPAPAAKGEAPKAKPEMAPSGTLQDVVVDEAGVAISGQNLPTPSSSTLDNGRVLLKFKDTAVKPVTKALKGAGAVVEAHWAYHSDKKETWLVLTVKAGNQGKIEKTEKGFSYRFGAPSKETQAVAPKTAPTALTTPTPVTGKGSGNANAAAESVPALAHGSARLIGQMVKPLSDGYKVVLTSDSPVRYKVHKLVSPDRVLILFNDTKMDLSDKNRNLKVEVESGKPGGLLRVEAQQLKLKPSPISEVILTLLPGALFQVDRDANQVVVTVTAAHPSEKMTARTGNLGTLVSVDLQGADLPTVLKALGAEAGFEVDVLKDVVGTVNQRLKDVPLRTALAILLSSANPSGVGYQYEVQGNLLRVGTASALANSKLNMPHITELITPGNMTAVQLDTLVKAVLPVSNAIKTTPDVTRNVLVLNGTPSDVAEYKSAMRDLKLDSSDTDRITRVVKLNYADPAALKPMLTQYLTPVGQIQVDPRSQSLIVWESAANMGVILEVIKELDVELQQVLIESTIVEVNTDHLNELGVLWTADNGGVNPGVSAGLTQLGSTFNPGAINFLTARAGFNVNATLNALESNQDGKIISRPKIATLNGQAALIETTENVIFTTQSITFPPAGSNPIITQSFVALPLPISLKVTPRITDDGKITTVIEVNITSASGPAPPSGPPPTTVQHAITTLTVKNGETIVIGGLVRDIVQTTVKRIPLLGSLPILGALFRNTAKENKKVELIIFVTPTLLES